MADLRDASLPRDLEAVGRLWLDYLTWGNDELESRYGFRLPVRGPWNTTWPPSPSSCPPMVASCWPSRTTWPSARPACEGSDPAPPRSSACTSNRPTAAPDWVGRCLVS